MLVKFKRLKDRAILPTYKTPGAAGMDLCACLDDPGERVVLYPGCWVSIPTGLAVEILPNYEAQVRPRSGLATRGITVLNSPGTIDSDYRGEILVMLINHGAKQYEVRDGDRIAQLVVSSAPQFQVEEVDALSDTRRGSGGFGSTGR